MNRRIFIAAAITAVVLITAVVSVYISMFGKTLAGSQDLWGQFGDYFGGLLNPLFGMLAFLALLWSITLQEHEFREASKHLSNQAEASRQELKLLRDDQIAQDLLHVIKDIDLRLEQLLRTVVSTPGTYPVLTVTHMLAESQRLASAGGESAAYAHFVELARSPGAVVEATIREIIDLVAEMRQFLEQYSQFKSGTYAPVIVYYANKVYRLLYMLETIGGIPDDTRQFFATVGDAHG